VTLLESFARTKRLKVKRDESGDVVVVGKLGQLYQHGDGLVGLVLISPSGDNPKLDNTLRSRMRKALQAGLELHQRGDYESSFVFNPQDRSQAQLAIRLVGIRRRRHQGGKGKPLTSERARYLARIRHGCAREGHREAQSDPIESRAEELLEVGV
jgi:hypothetical protein